MLTPVLPSGGGAGTFVRRRKIRTIPQDHPDKLWQVKSPAWVHISHRKSNMKHQRILSARRLAPVITDQDMSHMKTFSATKKQKIITKIMSNTPIEESHLYGNASYARALLRFRAWGLQLIDVQPHETVFTSVWYSETKSLLGPMKFDVAAMLVWEFGGPDGDSATLRIWHI